MDVTAQVQMLLLQAIALLSGTLVASADDPMTAVLDQRGVWRPQWLKLLNAQVEARYPGLVKPIAGVEFGGAITRFTGLQLIDGFIFHPIAKREDISDAIRKLYQDQHNYTFLAASSGDFGNVLSYLPLDSIATGPGYFTASLHSIHTDAAQVRELTERLYAFRGYLS